MIDAYSIPCAGGSLGLSAPSSIAFAATVLNGHDQTKTATATLTPDDETGAGSGWAISAYATAWSDGHGNTLPAPWVSAASVTAAGGNCSLPTSTVSYPTAALGTSAGTATKLYNAAVGTGAGPATLSVTFSQNVSANARIGSSSPDSFSSTWTFTISSGP